VKNALRFTYTPLSQIEHLYENPSGAVTTGSGGVPTGSTVVVDYAYANAAPAGGTGGSNYSRMTQMVRPDGVIQKFEYDDRISRMRLSRYGDATAGLPDEELIEYSYVGSNMVAVADYAPIDVQLDYTLSHDGKRRSGTYTSGTAGSYPGYDRFGRIARQAWADGTLSTHASLATVPNIPPIFEELYTYDRAANRLMRTDGRPGASWGNRDFGYSYDGLDRLTEAKRGHYDSTPSWVSAVGSQQWALDMLGNWSTVSTDVNGDGTYGGSGEVSIRTHNTANELISFRDPAALTIPTTPIYDDNGNLRQINIGLLRSGPLTYDHDAWNRLVRVHYPPVSRGSDLVIGEYEYYGLHWRSLKRADTSAVADGLDEQRAFYYDADWRIIEERVDSNYVTAPGLDRVIEQYWGGRYVDDAVMRRTSNDVASLTQHPCNRYFQLSDAQYSVRAVLDAGAKLVERVDYTAYGAARHHWAGDVDGDGAVSSSDSTYLLGSGISIGDASYRVECDLNRDGTVDTSDSSLIGSTKTAQQVGVISDPAGPDNDIGFDGYVYSPEASDYLARFRWYDALRYGRWIERDPAGYVAGSNLYEYVRSSPSVLADAVGLWDSSGHYYTTFIAAMTCGGTRSTAEAQNLAYYSQLPDQDRRFDAVDAGLSRMLSLGLSDLFGGFDKDIQEWLHSLHGGGPEDIAKRRACLKKMLESGELDPWEEGFVIHALGDAFAHVMTDQNGNPIKAFGGPLGHAFQGHGPDNIGEHPRNYGEYLESLCAALGGTPEQTQSLINHMDPNSFRGMSAEEVSDKLRKMAIGMTLDPNYDPDCPSCGGRAKMDGKDVPTPEQLRSLFDKMKKACPCVTGK
jgi:RHS repeat-associated protein